MRLLFAGSPPVAVPSLRLLLDSPHEVVGVLTRPPAPVGRKRMLTPTAVERFSQEAGLPVLHGRPHELMDELSQLNVDAVAVVAFGEMIREPALSLPPHGWINLHFSLLPAWRGAAPVQYAIMAGDEFTGASTFVIEAGLDTGPVLGTMVEPIHPRDTAGTLLERLSHSAAPLLASTIDAIGSGAAVPQRQSAEGVSHAPTLGAEHARISFNRPALVVDRHVRGVTPAPGGWATHQGDRFKLGPVQPVTSLSDPDPVNLRPGQVRLIQGRVLVGTASHPLELDRIAPPGKAWMAAADWLRGARMADDWSFDD